MSGLSALKGLGTRILDRAKDGFADVITQIRIPGATRPCSGGLPDRFPDDVLATAASNVGRTMAPTELRAAFVAIQRHAEQLAGAPGDIPQRVRHLHGLYRDSNGNHSFPMVALHGALCAKKYFDSAELVSNKVLARFLDGNELRTFSERMKNTNRQVFIDTYTNYHFSKLFGTQPGADAYLPKNLLDRLNAMHFETKEGRALSPEKKRELFEAALLTEQEVSVSRMVNQAAADFPYDFLEQLAFGADLEFAYFPEGEALCFDAFGEQPERVTAAMKAFDFAVEAGWSRVEESMQDYGVLSDDYFKEVGTFTPPPGAGSPRAPSEADWK